MQTGGSGHTVSLFPPEISEKGGDTVRGKLIVDNNITDLHERG